MIDTILINILSNACYDSLKFSIKSMGEYIKEKCKIGNFEISETQAHEIEEIMNNKFQNKEINLDEIREFILEDEVINSLLNKVKIKNSNTITQKNILGNNNISINNS